MNPQKTEDDLLLHHHHQHHDFVGPHHIESQPSINDDLFLFRTSSDSPTHSSSPTENDTVFTCLNHNYHNNNSNPNRNNNNNYNNSETQQGHNNNNNNNNDNSKTHSSSSSNPNSAYINPEPHISSQFYTFNEESHALMIRCILQQRIASPDEIRAATPRSVLMSWRSVWKDRNEDTAYLTGWKRIQEKLTAHVDPGSGNKFLCFKNNAQQFVSHINQWHDIVMSFHGDADLRHLGLRETIERIKQVWTVGAKFYGIPESYIRVCVAACPVCSAAEGPNSRNKRRRFEYTESFDVPAKEVPQRLQQLAAKHKVVLCIRQKYIRYKPFMAEVKDYACHRAGEPVSKKSKMLKREPYASKRCGCGFRIRAIVPISNYNEKDKTFVYQEEGMAVFKLYAVHTGHEPGPLDGNARIMHRVVGHKGGLMMDPDLIYGVREDLDNDDFGLMGKDEGDLQLSVFQQVQELKAEIGQLEGRLKKIPNELLGSISQELFDIVNKVRSIGDESSKTIGLFLDKPQHDDVLVVENDLAHWSEHQHDQIYGNDKDIELIEDDEDSFGQTLGDVVPWDEMRADCRSEKDLMGEPCKPEKWLKCCDFDEKSILDCEEDSKLTKPIPHDEAIVTDVGLLHVDSFYQENPKWYDSPSGLGSNGDCGDNDLHHGEIV